MDKQIKQYEQETLERAVVALRELGMAVDVRREPGGGARTRADALLRVRYGGKQLTYAAEVKRNLRPALLGAVLHQLGTFKERPLLVADHVTPAIAEKLRARGVAFVDTAGNTWLEDPPLLVWVTGRRPPERETRYARGRAFQASGLKVLFALLCKPEIVDLPYREIANYARVAHGTVGWVMAELPELGFVAKFRKRRILLQPEKLLTKWAEGYARTLRPKQLLITYEAKELGWWKDFDAAAYKYVLGGEPAGALMTKYLRPARITLYGDRINPKFAAMFQLQRAKQGNVEILKRFWNFEEDTPGLAPAPLVYADLLATGETRCLETADLIYERILDGFKRAK